jgi:hypothetical protein
MSTKPVADLDLRVKSGAWEPTLIAIELFLIDDLRFTISQPCESRLTRQRLAVNEFGQMKSLLPGRPSKISMPLHKLSIKPFDD